MAPSAERSDCRIVTVSNAAESAPIHGEMSFCALQYFLLQCIKNECISIGQVIAAHRGKRGARRPPFIGPIFRGRTVRSGMPSLSKDAFLWLKRLLLRLQNPNQSRSP